jgi:hypothetical protein
MGKIKKIILSSLIRVSRNWNIVITMHEALVSLIPGMNARYGIIDTGNQRARCKCCGGLIEVNVKGRTVKGSCAITASWKKEMQCNHGTIKKDGSCRCNVETCRGSDDDRMEGTRDTEIKLIIFKALKLLKSARKHGWSLYTDSGHDANKVIETLLTCGLNAIIWKSGKEYKTVVTGRMSSPKLGNKAFKVVRANSRSSQLLLVKRWHVQFRKISFVY